MKMDKAYENAFQFVSFKNVSEEDTDNERYHYTSTPTSEDLELVLEDILLAIDDTAAILTHIAKEIRRLQRYQDLYPTRAAMKRFHVALGIKLQDQHQRVIEAASKMHEHACWKKIQQAGYLVELWLKHPTFLPHLKPWEQFILVDSPGSGMNPRAKFLAKVRQSEDFEHSTASESSTFHILPPGGMALWADWTNKNEELKEKCRKVTTHLSWIFLFAFWILSSYPI
jgi:hypothetical protein